MKVALLQLAAIALAALALHRLVVVPRATGFGPAARATVRDPVALGVLLFAVSAIASTPTSLTPWISLIGAHGSYAGLNTMLAYAILFFAVRWLCTVAADAWRLLLAPVMAAALASSYALVQIAGIDPITAWSRQSGFGQFVRPFATMGNPNFLSAFLVMVFPVTVAFVTLALRQRQWLQAALLGLAAMLGCVAIAASVSRGAWLAFAAVLVVLVGGWFAVGARRSAAVLGGLLVSATALLLVLGVTLPGTGGGVLLQSVVQRAQQLSAFSSRRYIWAASIGMFREHPILGVGLDAFQVAFVRHRTAADWDIGWNVSPTKAHNEALHILATQGLLGAAAVVVLTAGLAWAGLAALRRAAPDDRPLVVAIIAGAAGFYVQDLFSFTVVSCGSLFLVFAALLSRLAQVSSGDPQAPDPPAALLGALGVVVVVALATLFHNIAESVLAGQPVPLVGLLVIVLALGLAGRAAFVLDQHGRSSPVSRRASAPTIPASGSAYLLVATVWCGAAALAYLAVVRPVAASVAARDGVQLSSVAPARAVPRLERAVALDPINELYWVKLGDAARAQALATRDPVERRRLLGLAREAFERSIRLVPADSFNYANLGQLLGDLGREGLARPEDAWAAFDAALRLDPNNAYFYSAAANTALVLGDLTRARQYAERGSERHPKFALTRWQLGHLAAKEGNREDAARLLRQALDSDWHGALRSRASAALSLAGVYLELGQPEQALGAARTALETVPDSADARFHLARALEQLGRRGEAVEEYRRVLSRRPDYTPARQALRALGAS